MNCIEELYYGNLEPQELTVENSSELKRKLSKLVLKEDELTSLLNAKEKELFSEYTGACTEFTSISNVDSFISGFRIGARLIYDTFVTK